MAESLVFHVPASHLQFFKRPYLGTQGASEDEPGAVGNASFSSFNSAIFGWLIFSLKLVNSLLHFLQHFLDFERIGPGTHTSCDDQRRRESITLQNLLMHYPLYTKDTKYAPGILCGVFVLKVNLIPALVREKM